MSGIDREGKRLGDYKRRQMQFWGKDKVDFSNLDSADPSIIAAYEDGNRRIFDYSMDGERQVRGYVGITTGWKPGFIVLYSRRSSGGGLLPNGAKAIAISGGGRRDGYHG